MKRKKKGSIAAIENSIPNFLLCGLAKILESKVVGSPLFSSRTAECAVHRERQRRKVSKRELTSNLQILTNANNAIIRIRIESETESESNQNENQNQNQNQNRISSIAAIENSIPNFLLCGLAEYWNLKLLEVLYSRAEPKSILCIERVIGERSLNGN